MSDAHHTIQAVVRRTGLSAHVIRIWEKRYHAVRPVRTKSNRRVYSTEEIERLSLLRDLSRAGHSISSIASLTTDELRKITAEEQPASHAPAKSALPSAPSLLGDCIAAVRVLDARALESALKRAAVELGAQGILQRLIAPIAHAIGELWRDGEITAAHEHFASEVIRTFLGHTGKSFAGAEGAPLLIVATPTGQLHELGALLAASLAVNLGWRVIYLGPSLPAAEIAGAARQNRARAVALSLVYPEDDARLETEFTSLRELLPAEIAIVAGGRVVSAYHDSLKKIGAFEMRDLAHLGETLDQLRQPAQINQGAR